METIDKNCKPEEICSLLKRDGIVLIPNYLPSVYSVKKETLEVLDEFGTDYPFGRNGRTGKWFPNEAEYAGIHKLFKNVWMKKITDLYFGAPSRFCESVFMTHDFKNTGELGRNGYLHFDRTMAFKFLVYLMDCETLEHGPFMCYPGTHNEGKKLRLNMPKGRYETWPNRLEIDYPELGYTAEKATPVFGKAGMMMIFDSDMFHLGGRVSNGKERLVIRSHSRAK